MYIFESYARPIGSNDLDKTANSTQKNEKGIIGKISLLRNEIFAHFKHVSLKDNENNSISSNFRSNLNRHKNSRCTANTIGQTIAGVQAYFSRPNGANSIFNIIPRRMNGCEGEKKINIYLRKLYRNCRYFTSIKKT